MPLVVEYVGLTYLSKSRDAMTPPAPQGTTVLPLTIQYTVFPRIVVATTILFWRVGCDNYSRETTIQRRKLLFFLGFWKCT